MMQQAEDNRRFGEKTIVFVDEIHRFNKAQQDYLLPFVEDGTVILIGATTENPYFEVNGALLSRSIIFELKPIPSVLYRPSPALKLQMASNGFLAPYCHGITQPAQKA